jgi:hypothetical protein
MTLLTLALWVVIEAITLVMVGICERYCYRIRCELHGRAKNNGSIYTLTG